MSQLTTSLKLNDEIHTLELKEWEKAEEDAPGQLQVLINDEERTLRYRVLGPDRLRILWNGRTMEVRLARDGHTTLVSVDGCSLAVQRQARRRGGAAAELPPVVTPPTPAVVVQLLVEVSQTVTKGQGVVVVSAMKLETTLKAPHDGTVASVNVAEGDQVMPGDELVVITPAETEEAKEDDHG